MVKIGDIVDVDFDLEGVLKTFRGKIVGKAKSKDSWKVDFEDGDSFDVPFLELKPVKDNKNQGGMGV
jgi:hypothetical protein